MVKKKKFQWPSRQTKVEKEDGITGTKSMIEGRLVILWDTRGLLVYDTLIKWNILIADSVKCCFAGETDEK